MSFFTKVVKDDRRLSLFVKSFWDSALFWNRLGLSRILNES